MASRASSHFHCSFKLYNRRLYSSARIIQEHDIVLVRQHGAKRSKWRLTRPLRSHNDVRLAHGAQIRGLDIIGRKYLDSVTDDQGSRCVLHEVPLATYITHTARAATPIYPADANTIVSLLDLHPARYGEDTGDGQDEAGSSPPFEIFEAGTGMGSLTLHLARAIHASNPPLPSSLRSSLMNASVKPGFRGSSLRSILELDSENESSFHAYLETRRAVIHTLDHKPQHSLAAYSFVRNFRRAQYLPSVEFHVGSIESYVVPRLDETGSRPFFAHAVLDLPSAHDHAAPVIRALKPNGLLILFKPSISQIAEFQSWATRTGQPIRQERVVELSNSSQDDGAPTIGGGGRSWDVRLVKPRNSTDDNMVQVLRPKVGDKIAGGGFLAVYRVWPGQDVTSSEDALSVVEEATEILMNGSENTEEDALTNNSTADEGTAEDEIGSGNMIALGDEGVFTKTKVAQRSRALLGTRDE